MSGVWTLRAPTGVERHELVWSPPFRAKFRIHCSSPVYLVDLSASHVIVGVGDLHSPLVEAAARLKIRVFRGAVSDFDLGDECPFVVPGGRVKLVIGRRVADVDVTIEWIKA